MGERTDRTGKSRRHIAQDMIRYVLPLTNPEKDITVTTYREDDPNGTAAFRQTVSLMRVRIVSSAGQNA